MAKQYALIVGVVLLLAGVCGFFMHDLFGLIVFHPIHNVIHLGSGAIGVLVALGKNPNGPRTFAQVFGVIYTLVAIAGFFGVVDLGSIQLGLNTTYNLIHLVVGLLGIAAGFIGAKPATA